MGLIVLGILALIVVSRIPELVSQSDLGIWPQRCRRVRTCDRGIAEVRPSEISGE